MRLAEIMAEEDLPVIYDIVRAKLAAKQKIMLAFQTKSCFYQVLSLTTMESLAGDGSAELFVLMDYLAIPKDPGVNLNARVDSVSNLPSDLEGWSLKKKDGYWELAT
jgi:hypothetical protein